MTQMYVTSLKDYCMNPNDTIQYSYMCSKADEMASLI